VQGVQQGPQVQRVAPALPKRLHSENRFARLRL
jgi:hypothetical protein